MIEIKSAINLPAADKGTGSSDPFISCHINGKKAKTHFKTHHVEKNLNPIWTTDNTWGPFSAYDLDVFVIKVWDHDSLKDDIIGEIKIKGIEIGLGDISLPFGKSKKSDLFGGTLNIKVSKGENLKPPKKIKPPKVDVDVNIEGKER